MLIIKLSVNCTVKLRAIPGYKRRREPIILTTMQNTSITADLPEPRPTRDERLEKQGWLREKQSIIEERKKCHNHKTHDPEGVRQASEKLKQVQQRINGYLDKFYPQILK
jgi:predicted Rossmann fold nucleotide-binding protein DprA/Smf involved in DNA uptake